MQVLQVAPHLLVRFSAPSVVAAVKQVQLVAVGAVAAYQRGQPLLAARVMVRRIQVQLAALPRLAAVVILVAVAVVVIPTLVAYPVMLFGVAAVDAA